MSDDLTRPAGRDRDAIPGHARHPVWWPAVLGASAVAAWLVLWGLAGLPGVRGPWQASLAVEAAKVALGVAAVVGGVVLLVSRQRAAGERDADAREGRVAEMYGRAVEQLGHEKAPVRLGGAYALDRLGRRHAEYRQMVVDVWCAYLRMPVEVAEEPEKSIAPMGADSGDGQRGGRPVFPAGEREVRLSVQRLVGGGLREWGPLDVDLTGAVLLNVDFSGARFGQGVFDGATLVGVAEFSGAVFEEYAGFGGVGGEATVVLSGARFGGTAFFWDSGVEFDLEGAVVARVEGLVGGVPGWGLEGGAGASNGVEFLREE
ncbi:pentapeptide repeat-containing protein [Phytomonospora sp. NPDC050363]|uniref:pentapeptide repeat-containing protein n=1 Tax=Phytomonospora sp. NPDC050363 TaxID=3155642 RepID=UPI0033C38501